MQRLPEVNVPFRGKLDFEVYQKPREFQNQQEHQHRKEGTIVFFSKTQGKVVITFDRKEHFRIRHNGDSLAVIPISGDTLKVQTYF
jgi:hypothetical protein